MAMFILDDATGIGSDDLDTFQAFIDLVIIANDDGVGLDDPAGGMQQVTYARTGNGVPQLRLDTLVNTNFNPDYGSGAQNVDIIVIPGLSGFTLDDGTPIQNNGTALPPGNSGLPGASLNTTNDCLVIYDTQSTICVARDGTGGDIDLPISNPVILYHEFSHAFRIVNNNLLNLTAECDPSSPEENAAIVDENDLRTQLANRQGATPELRDPNIHCGEVNEDCGGGCCIIASLASKSYNSSEVQYLRSVRDHFVRSTEVGYAFFDQFFKDYYSFSPQVVTLMSQENHLSKHLMAGYIGPLLEFWKMMIERSKKTLNIQELADLFSNHHTDIKKSKETFKALNITSRYWLNYSNENNSTVDKLMSLLMEKATASEYIEWSVITPVKLYYNVLKDYLNGVSGKILGSKFLHAIETWVSEIPIDDVWGSLPEKEANSELKFVHDILLQTDNSKNRFHKRLNDRFGDVTALQKCISNIS